MALKGKHNVAEINGVRCSVVETGITEERSDFLADLLAFNGFEVKREQEKDKEGNALGTFMIGVTDILFNPVIAVYGHRLRRKNDIEVTPAFWEQKNTRTEIPYWQVQRQQ